MNRYDLYTLCAQNPERDARALHAIYRDGAQDRPVASPTLGEDFCAAAAICRAWCKVYPRARAVGVDRDPEALAHSKPHPRVRLVCADVARATPKVDLIGALNFSICEIHRRASLVKYLRHARSRLRVRGSFICDVYSGADAFATGVIRQRVVGPRAEQITYRWEQRTADPVTGRVTNAMHFDVAPAPKVARGGRSSRAGRAANGAKTLRFHDAFVYDWRLWGLPELSDAMLEAGYSRVEVYPRTADAVDQHGELYLSPVRSPGELSDSFNVFVAARR